MIATLKDELAESQSFSYHGSGRVKKRSGSSRPDLPPFQPSHADRSPRTFIRHRPSHMLKVRPLR